MIVAEECLMASSDVLQDIKVLKALFTFGN
jgi:hypothetical protein